MGWHSPSSLPPSLVSLSIAKHASSKGEPAFTFTWWGECSFPVSFLSAWYKCAGVVVCVCACMMSFQPACVRSWGSPDHADPVHLPACFSVLFSQYLWICWPVFSGWRWSLEDNVSREWAIACVPTQRMIIPVRHRKICQRIPFWIYQPQNGLSRACNLLESSQLCHRITSLKSNFIDSSAYEKTCFLKKVLVEKNHWCNKNNLFNVGVKSDAEQWTTFFHYFLFVLGLLHI